MSSEKQKMLAGELYDPLDAELAAACGRARDLCQARNATREAEQDERRRIVRELLGAGAGSVVTRDIPGKVFAAGNPCRVLRKIAK